MALAPLVEQLLVEARKYDEHVASGRTIPGERDEDEAYVQARQAIIDGAEAIKMKAMTPDMILFTYMSRVSQPFNSSRIIHSVNLTTLI